MSKVSSRGNYAMVDNPGFAFDRRPDDQNIASMFTTVLDQTLTSPNIRDLLVRSKTMDQKWKLVQAHHKIFEKSTTWGEKENALLESIESSDTPDIGKLSELKVVLSLTSVDFMKTFIEAQGIEILLNGIETRLSKVLTEFDVAILFEIMLCLKLVMNHSFGMDAFLEAEGGMDVVARCLNFNHKFFALQVNQRSFSVYFL